MKPAIFLAAFVAVAMGFGVHGGEKADADRAKIAEHFQNTSADFKQSRSNWRWVFYGDSITHGCAHTAGWRNFVEIFQERLRWEKAVLFDTVINSGNSGYSSTHLVDPGQYAWQVGDYKPAVVVILIGANDIVLPDADINRFRANLETLVDRVRNDGAIPVLMTYNTMRLLRNPSAKWEHDYVKRYQEFPAYNEVIRDVAARRDCILVDHERYWREHASDPAVELFWLPEHLHPGPRGHQEMARLICQELGLGTENSACFAIQAGGAMPPAPSADPDNASLLKRFSEFTGWEVLFDAARGRPETQGWNNPYSATAATLVDGALRLDHRRENGGVIRFNDTAKLNSLGKNVLCEIEMRVLPDDDPAGRSNRFYIECVAGLGEEKTEAIIIADSQNIRGTLGTLPLPVDCGKFFKLRFLLDTVSRRARLWVDDTPVGDLVIEPVTDLGPRLSFGYGSSSIGGVIEVKSVRLGSY